MDETRPSVDSIVSHWSDRHGNRFASSIRREAMRELIEDMVSYGYGRRDAENAKTQILSYCVGSSTKKGTLNDWKKKVLEDWRRTILEVFEPVQRPTGPVQVPFSPIHKSQEELDAENAELDAQLAQMAQEQKEIEESHQISDDVIISGEPVFRPELDKSIFPKIETTPIMSVEDFLATIEKENREYNE